MDTSVWCAKMTLKVNPVLRKILGVLWGYTAKYNIVPVR